MFASTSRAVLRSSVGRTAAFSTSAPHAARKTVVVELLQDVQGLGHTHDRVSVTEGRMRHTLVPFRLARYIPWKRASERAVKELRSRPRPRLDQPLIDAPSATLQTSPTAAEPTPQALLDALYLVPELLTFGRRTVSPTTPALHGSLTLSDLADLLATQHGLPSADVEVAWVGQEPAARMKEIGTWEASVVVRGRGGEARQVAVEVVRQE